jgi:hypothetical protein
MAKSHPTQTLQQFDARLHEAGLEMSTLQAGLDIQWKRIEAHRHRQSLGAPLIEPSPNGNGHTDRLSRLR